MVSAPIAAVEHCAHHQLVKRWALRGCKYPPHTRHTCPDVKTRSIPSAVHACNKTQKAAHQARGKAHTMTHQRRWPTSNAALTSLHTSMARWKVTEQGRAAVISCFMVSTSTLPSGSSAPITIPLPPGMTAGEHLCTSGTSNMCVHTPCASCASRLDISAHDCYLVRSSSATHTHTHTQPHSHTAMHAPTQSHTPRPLNSRSPLLGDERAR